MPAAHGVPEFRSQNLFPGAASVVEEFKQWHFQGLLILSGLPDIDGFAECFAHPSLLWFAAWHCDSRLSSREMNLAAHL